MGPGPQGPHLPLTPRFGFPQQVTPAKVRPAATGAGHVTTRI